MAEQRKTDPRWTPQDEQSAHDHYRNTAPGWGQVRHTPRATSELIHGAIHAVEHSTKLRVHRASVGIDGAAVEGSLDEAGDLERWQAEATQLAVLVDRAIRNLLPVTGNATITRLRTYLADLKGRLVSHDALGASGSLHSIEAALATAVFPAASPGKPNSAADIASLYALVGLAAKLLERAPSHSDSARDRNTGPRVRQFRGV